MNRRLVPAVVTLLIVAALPLGAASALAGDFVSVSTTVPTANPVPGEPFTIETTVSNADDSDDSYLIQRVTVRRGSSRYSELLAEREGLRRIAPGDTERIALSPTLNNTGERTVYVHLDLLRGRPRHVVQPVTVRVRQPHPKVELSASSGPVGPQRRVNVTVANGLERPVRNVELAVDGPGIEVRDPRRVAATLGRGTDAGFAFLATPDSDGTHEVRVQMAYTRNDTRRSVTYTRSVDFRTSVDPVERPQLELSVPAALPGASRPVNVTLANGLDRAVRRATVTVSSPAVNFSTTQRVRARLAAGATATFGFEGRVPAADRYPVTVTVRYTTGDVRRKVQRTFRPRFGAPANPGEVRLTGVDAVRRGGSLELSATASNVGSGAVESVVVAVAETPAVEGAEYFVGGIDASDFASFTLTTGIGGNVSAVPVTVTYVVDGVERSVRTEVPVDRAAVPGAEPSGGGPGALPLVGAGAVVVLLVLGGVLYRRRG